MLNCRRARCRPAFASVSAALAASLFCVALPSASWAQSGVARAAAASAQAAGGKKADKTDNSIKTALIKSIGKDDGELFGNLLQTLGDGKSVFHVIAETTAEIKQEGFNGSISGRTEMRGNYGSAFVSDAELTAKQGEQSHAEKTKFVCDGQTLWIYKPDEDQYTEQPFATAKPKMADEVMGASFDIAGLLASEAANGFKNTSSPATDAATYKVDQALFRGVPCRILTISGVSTKQDKAEAKGRFRVFVGLDKRLRGLQLQLSGKDGAEFMTLTQLVKVMEAMTPAPTPQDALFHFSPPAGAKKVDSFEESGDE